MDAPQFEGLRKVDGLRKVAAMDAPQFEGRLPGGRLEAGWRQARGTLTIEAVCAGETGFHLQMRLYVHLDLQLRLDV